VHILMTSFKANECKTQGSYFGKMTKNYERTIKRHIF
jgi:hypothetical protein